MVISLYATKQTVYTSLCLLTGFTITCSIPLTPPAMAQIVPDNTLGSENSVVTPNVDIRGINSDRIDGGAVRGGNLFHSFQEFNVDVGRGAYFSNPDSIVNILTRVTGDNISNILGTLGVLGNANLFFINPNGIVFGPNARLDVGGSFFASTADGILFENGVEFAASNPEAPPLLTINIPLGLNIRENPGSIVNQAQPQLVSSDGSILLRDNNGVLIPQGLNVPQNQTLALVGGDVVFDNGIAISPGSNIELGGLSQPGIVELNNVGANGNTPSLQFPANIQRANIALTNESQINIRADDGGNINVNAGNFEMSGGSIIRAGIDANLGFPEARGGDVNINAQNSIILIDSGSSIRNNIESNAIGNPGEINITANSLLIENGTFLSTTTFGSSNAGNVTIQASESVQLISGDIFSSVNDNGIGNAGTVEINTTQLELRNGSQIVANTTGIGNAGNILIRASEFVEISGRTPDGQFSSALFTDVSGNAIGNGGNILIETGQLQLLEGSQINVSTDATGNAGTIRVKAENINLSESSISPAGENFSSALIADSQASGNAGTVIIEAQQLRMTDGTAVSVAAFDAGDAGTIIIRASDVELLGRRDDLNPSVLDASVQSSGTGSGGSVTIEAERLVLRDGGRIQATTADGIGQSGRVSILASESVELSGTVPDSIPGSNIFTDTTGTANAGDITIITPSLSVRDDSGISALADDSATGNGGNIRILASDSVEIIGLGTIDDPTTLVSTGTTGSGTGGNITIETARLTIADGVLVGVGPDPGSSGEGGNISLIADLEVIISDSALQASTKGTGRGGDITINTERLVFQNNALVSAASLEFPDQTTPAGGEGGKIEIFASDSVEVNDSSIFADTNTTGDAGDVTIQTQTLRVLNESVIFVDSSLADEQTTPGGGDAGNVDISASEWVELKENSGIFADTNTTGDAGNVTLKTETLRMLDGSGIFVNSDSSGVPGNIEITATSTSLNQSFLAAISEAGEGGSIKVESNDVRLLNRSVIRANGSESGQTFEGNIEIDANLLVLLQGSGIITDASNPTGGSNITIRPLGGSELAVLQSQNTTIRAAGELSIDDTLNFDPPESLEVTVVDPNDLIAQEFCRQRGTSQFTITGRGGLVSSPYDIFTGDHTQVPLVEPVPSPQNRSTSTQRPRTEPNQPRSSADIIPARGWIRDENGDVILVSYDPTKTGVRRQPVQFPQCQP